MERATFSPPLHSIADVTLEFCGTGGRGHTGESEICESVQRRFEAVEAAMKFVRQYHKQTGNPGKYKFVSRYHGYHGGTFGGMAASGTGPRKSKFEPQMAGFLKVFPPTHYRDRFASCG